MGFPVCLSLSLLSRCQEKKSAGKLRDKMWFSVSHVWQICDSWSDRLILCRCSTNDYSSHQGIEGLESLTDSLSRLRGIRTTGSNISQYVGSNRETQQVRPGETVLKNLVGDPEWFLNSLDRAQFACNTLLLLQSSSPNSLAGRHWDLTETLVVVQCLASDNGVKASRNLAKKLLKTHSQVLSPFKNPYVTFKQA